MILLTRENRLWGWGCLLTMLAGASLMAATQEQFLQYHSQLAQQRSMLDVMGSRSLKLSEKASDGIQLPQFQSNQPLFAQWTSPMAQNGHLLIALDRIQEKGPYDRMFIDLNEDGHLKDETAISASWTSSESATFGPIELTFTDSGKSIKYHLNFEFFSYEDTRELTVYADGQYEGKINAGAEEKYCVLIDNNANGAFNDAAHDVRQSDRIQIGQPDERKSLKTYYVGNFIEIDGQLYELEVAQNGSYLKLTPTQDVSFGKVELPEDITEFAVGGENGLFTFKPEKGQVELPVGKYHIEYWALRRPDKKGNQWKLRGAEFGGRGDFEVYSETETTLSIGEPVTCRLDIINTGPATYTLNQIFKGQLDESISLTRNEAPTGDLEIHVKNADGTYVKTEFLEDAWGGDCPLTWREPENITGPFTITTDVAGPFEVENLPAVTKTFEVQAATENPQSNKPQQNVQKPPTGAAQEEVKKPSPPPSLQPSPPPPLPGTAAASDQTPSKNWIAVLVIMLLASVWVLLSKSKSKKPD